MPKKKNDKDKPDINPELEGFEIEINEFGEIKSSMDVDKVNEFLNRNVEDKKLKGREEEDEESDNSPEDESAD